jgi:hypothetical protein
MPRCAATKPDGEPCERIVSASRRFCFAHDPSAAQQRSRNASKAARSKPSRELAGVKERLRVLAEDVLARAVDLDAASVASRVLGVYLRAVEQERKLRELDDLIPRIEALEERLKQEGGSRRWG